MRPVELLSHLRSLGVKVWAEGDRLRYNAPKGALSPELLAELAARKGEILSFLHKGAVGSARSQPILPTRREGPLPLSFAQQRLWFIDQLSPGLPGYNIPTALRLSGQLDKAALQQSLDTIIGRHEALRTTFTAVDGQPVQVIAPTAPLRLAEVDLRTLPAAEREAAARREAIAEAQRPFDLARGPLVRTILVRLDETEYLALFTLHHIIADAWSIGVLVRELAALYAAYADGGKGGVTAPLPPLPIQYADFAIWQRQWLEGQGDGRESPLQQQLAYWRRQLGGHLPSLDLPVAHQRPPAQTFVGATRSFALAPDLAAALYALNQREGVTLFMTLLAAFQILLHRYTAQTDILVGSPIANRTRAEIEPLIGFFVNTLVLRTSLAGNPTVRELLRRVREVTLEAYSHQDLPFERLVEELRPERDLSRTPLFQVMFVLQNAGMASLELPGLTLQLQASDTGTAKFDLLLEFAELADGLVGGFEYNTDLFDTPAIDRMIGHLQTLLEGMAADPDRRVDDLPLLTAAERQQVLSAWNDTAAEGLACCVHQLFERQVELTPDSVAVEFPASGQAEAAHLTYRQLNERANQLAHHLRSLGVGPEVRVGICMDRSIELVLGMLAVLKAGGAYVPLDPSYPQDRLAFMLEDAQASVLLTATIEDRGLKIEDSSVGGTTSLSSILYPLSSGRVVDLLAGWPSIAQQPDTNPASGATPENLAYVIYTSGSTGRPKGVAMPHRALANLLDWQLRSFTVPHPARTLQFSSPSFDVSFQEIFSTWCSGGSLILIADDLRRDPTALLRFLNDNAIERLFLPFVALQQIAEVLQEQGTPPRHLCEIITAGEQLRVTQAIASWLGDSPECTLHNHYGPSESHVVTTFTLHGPPGEWPALPPIGRPIANTAIYLLDARMQPVPIGVPGELYISGANLARGYLDRPNLTAEKFVPNPFAIAKNKEQRTENKDQTICNLQSAICNRLYKTGDLARYLPDGNIEFLGRADTQVKLRGYRIELGEVEAALEQHPRVREAVVVAREDTPGEKRLVAYFVPSQAQRTENKEQGDKRPETSRQADRQADQSAEVSILNSQFSISELRAFLQERLPGYMVPAVFAALETWPLTPSGKVDRRALPAPEQSAVERQDSYVAPRDTLELELARMWEELLGVQSIGIRDSFFDLGGHSLLVVRLISRMQKQFGQSPPLSALFQEATVEHLARTLRGRAGPLSRSPLVGLRPAGTKKPFFCVHPGAGNVLCYLELAHRLGADQPFYGLQAAGIEGEQPPRTQVEEMAAAYLDALRAVQPEGPYLLGGWSFGGLVAFEMARQLHIQGQEIGLLALIDSYAPPPDPEPAGDDVGLLAWFAYDLARRFGKEPPVSADDLRRVSPERRLPYLLELAQAADILPADIDERQIRGAIEVFTANMRAMRSYWPPTYAGRVTLLRAGEIAPGEPREPTLGWGAVALGGVEVFDIAGDHYTIVSPPHVQALAERLGACIDAVQIGHTNSV